MSLTDPNSFAPDLPTRGGGRTVDGKPSETTAQAVERIAGGPSWGSGATVTYGFRTTGTPLEGTGFSPFNTAQIRAAESALLAWSDIANIRFRRVDGDQATILFGNFTEGELAGYAYSPGDSRPGSLSGDVWINASDPDNVAAEPNFFGAHVILHELGHAIGLDHPSDYDNDDPDDVSYETLAAYYEDTIQYTVMSYFFEFNTSGDYGEQYPSAPMLDDVAALQRLYGANTSTRTGDTVYGFNSNTGRDWLSATGPSATVMFAAWDAGGTDTFDFSGFSGRQAIDLRQGAFSDVLGFRDNVSVALGTVIENARGGSGQDLLVGNNADNALDGGDGFDELYGEGGNDVLRGGAGFDLLDGGGGDNLIDGGPGDDMLLLRGTLSDYASSPVDGAWRISGRGTTHLVRDVESVRFGNFSTEMYGFDDFVARTGATGGPIVTGTDKDFNGDGRADLLWRKADGAVSSWLFGENAASARADAYAQVGTEWRLAETFDFNGDGRADILWRRTDGALAVWRATDTGFDPGAYLSAPVSLDWSIAAVGDLDADGRDDLIWRNRDGSVSTWQSTGSGFYQNSFFAPDVSADWRIVGSGDLNGDGRSDILWRNGRGALSEWWSTESGFRQNAYYDDSVGPEWHIDGIGDIDGNRTDDLVWRRDNGDLAVWYAFTTFHLKNRFFDGSVPNSWQVADVGDYSGDGKEDILWRRDDGALSVWRAGTDDFDRNAFYTSSVGNDWSVAAHVFPL